MKDMWKKRGKSTGLIFIKTSGIRMERSGAFIWGKKRAVEDIATFEVDQVLIKVLVKTGESLGKEIRVMNTGTKEENIKVEASGLLNIAKIIDKEFTINPGQTKIVRINLSSFDRENGIEHAPGVYIGKIIVKSGGLEKEIPIIVEIETKEVLFDGNLNPVSRDRKILQGSDMIIEVRLFNLQSTEATNVDMNYFVKDLNGNTIISERENVVVETQTSFFKTLKIPQNLKLGTYVFVAQASYGNSVGTGSYLFEVTGEEKKPVSGFILLGFVQFCRNDALCWTLSLVILLLIFTIGAYLYFFLGAYLYNKFFGIKLQLRRVKEKPIMIIDEKEERKESRLKEFFRNWKENRKKRKEEKLKKELELKIEKLKLNEEKEKRKIQLKKEEGILEAKRKEEGQKQIQIEKERKEEEREIRRNRLKEFFRNWKIKREKIKQEKLSEKLRWKKQKLRLKAEKERLKEKKGKEKAKQIQLEKNLMEEKKNRRIERHQEGLVNKCNKLAKKGYKAIEKGRIRKAKKLYNKLMGFYFNLSSKYKKEVFGEMNSLYGEIKKREMAALKEGEAKKSELEKKKIEAEKRRKEEEDERLRIEAKKERERRELKKLKERERVRKIEKEELQKREAIKKKEQEDRLREQEKRRREEEKKKLDAVKKIEEKPVKKKKPLFSRLFGRKEALKEKSKKIEIKEKVKPKNLERQIAEMGKKFEESSGLKEAGFLRKIGLSKPKEEKGSKLFIKCQNFIDRSYKHLDSGNRNKARKLYSKAKKIYEKLEYEEKKTMYKRLMNNYNMQNK